MQAIPIPADCCDPCAGAVSACSITNVCPTKLAVKTTAAARALVGLVDLDLVVRLGDLTPYDGQGMDYWFDASSFEVDNGGSVLRPTYIDVASPGRLLQHI